MSYNFKAQYTKGEIGEKELDKLFESLGYTVQHVSINAQKMGIDRIFKKEFVYSVEYKTDFFAHKTNNIFFETEIISDKIRRGWYYKSIAQVLIYYIKELKICYWFNLLTLRELLLIQHRQSIEVENNGYRGVGFLVPIKEIEQYGTKYFVE